MKHHNRKYNKVINHSPQTTTKFSSIPSLKEPHVYFDHFVLHYNLVQLCVHLTLGYIYIFSGVIT